LKFPYSELESRLDEKVEPVYLLVGDQDLLRELAAKKLQNAVVGEFPSPFSPFNFERFDGENGDASRIVMSANMMPLLGGRRLILVKRASRLVESEPSLQAYVEDPNPATVLVLDLDKKPDGRRKGWKDLEKKLAVVACDAPDPWELQDWVAEEGRGRGLKLGRDEVRYLVTEVGSDLRRLSNELEKLSLYASGDQLDLETMAEVLGRGRAQGVFKFIDAVASGDAGSALRQLGRLLEEGEPPLRILALLDRLVGQLRIAKDAQASGKKDSNLAGLLGAPPSAAKAIGESARRLDRGFLRRAVEALADTDRLLKSSRLPHRVVMEGLVLELARGSRRYADTTRRASRDL
jgi:DNA polymerase-3 subunit delta